jgi:hypothetical protein
MRQDIHSVERERRAVLISIASAIEQLTVTKCSRGDKPNLMIRAREVITDYIMIVLAMGISEPICHKFCSRVN